jgi:hypothetical protein
MGSRFLKSLAGLPIVRWADDPAPLDAAAVAWKVDTWNRDYTFAWVTDIDEALEAVLERTGPEGPVALTIGDWSEPMHEPFDIALLTNNADRLGRLRALFIGDIDYEECELHSILQMDITPVLDAFPALEVLGVRGTEGLGWTPTHHESLRTLVLQSAEMPAVVVRSIAAGDYPALTHLELWMGSWLQNQRDNDGSTARAEDLAPILSGHLLPSLVHLGLRNAQPADSIAAALATAPLVARLTDLDLSLGAFGDAGAEALLAGQPLTHLNSLDLRHHFMSPEMTQRLVDALPGVHVDVSDRQDGTMRERDGTTGFTTYNAGSTNTAPGSGFAKFGEGSPLLEP